jgi:hypothetical protein
MVQPLPAVAEATPPGKAAQTTGDPPPPPPPVVDTGIKYCGSIIGPRWSSALLSSGDTKEMVAEGQTFQGAKLVEVLANKVVVEDGAGRRDLTLEVRPATLFPDNSSVHAAATPGSNPDTIPPGFDKLPPEEQMRYLNEKRNGNIINGERVGKPPTTGVPPPRPAPRPMTPMTPKNEKPIGKEGR